MALDSIEQKILDKYGGGLDPVEQRILDKVRSSQESGGGGGGVPDSTIAPEAAPIQPGVPVLPEGEPDGRFSGEADSESPVIFGEEDKASTIGRIAKGLRTSILALGGAEMQHQMNITGQQLDPEVMQQIAEDQQKFNQYTLEQMDYLDKPRRVITNLAFALQERGLLQSSIMKFPQLQQGIVTPKFSSIKDAAAKGWSGEDSVSLLKVAESGAVGVNFSNKIEAFEKRHWQLKYQRVAADFASDIVADAAVDFLLGKVLLTPIKSLTKVGVVRFGTEAMKDRILKTAASKLDEGFESVVTKTANDIADLKGPTRRSWDDMARDSIDSFPDELQGGSGDLIPPATVFEVTDADILAQQSKLLVDRVKTGRLNRLLNEVDEELAVRAANPIGESTERVKPFLFHGSPEGQLDSIDVKRHTKLWRDGVGFYATESSSQAESYAAGLTARGARREATKSTGAINIVRNMSKNTLDMFENVDIAFWTDVARKVGIDSDVVDDFASNFSGVYGSNQSGFDAVRKMYIDKFGEDGVFVIQQIFQDKGIDALRLNPAGTFPSDKNIDRIFVFLDPDAMELVDISATTANRINKSARQSFGSIVKAQAQYDNFVLKSRRQLLTDQLVQATKKTDESRSILSHLEEGRHAIDYKATTRDLRIGYIEATVRRMEGSENFDSIKEFIKTVSGNTTDDVAELMDEELAALFDFIETRVKDPKNWDYASTDVPGMEGSIKRIGRRLFLNQTVSPSWQVFRRLGGERVYQFVDDAFFQRYAHVERSLSGWEDELVNLGIQGKRRSDKGKESLRKVFLLADDRATSIDDGVATFNVTTGPTAKESWITPISKAEIRAAKFINKDARVLADMAVAQGRISATGKDAPKRIKHYITHLFDQNIVGAKKAKEKLLERIEALKGTLDDLSPADTLKAEREIADMQGVIDGEIDVNLRKLAEHYEKNAKTDVNIPEFLSRTNYREGLFEDADASFRAMITHETDALYMQPAYRKAMVMAKETGNDNLEQFTRKWINDIRGVPTTGRISETSLEPLVKDFSLLLERGTSWIPWQRAQWKAEDKAVRQFSRVFRSKTYAAAMGFNPGPVATNMTQNMLNISAIGWKSTTKGFESLTTEGGKSALRHARILVGRNPMHSMSLREMSRLQRAGGWTFRQIDQWMNVAPAFNGSLHKQITRNADKMAILRNYGEIEGRSFWNSLGKALDAGEFAGDVDIANRVAKLTQYSYLRHDSPAFLRTPLGGLFGQFMSWPANYFQSYLPEMTKWMMTGDSPFGKLGLVERATLLRHIVLAESLIAAGGQAGIDLKKHRPISIGHLGGIPIPVPAGPLPQLTPALRVMSGIAGFAFAGGNKRKEEQAALEIKKGLMVGPAYFPFFPAALRRVGKAAEMGDARHLFWRVSEDDGEQELGGTNLDP